MGSDHDDQRRRWPLGVGLGALVATAVVLVGLTRSLVTEAEVKQLITDRTSGFQSRTAADIAKTSAEIHSILIEIDSRTADRFTREDFEPYRDFLYREIDRLDRQDAAQRARVDALILRETK